MTDERFIPDTEHLQALVYAIYQNAQRLAQGYTSLIFSERIERTLDGIAPEVRDEFMQLAIDIGGYTPSHYQVRTMEPANDELYD